MAKNAIVTGGSRGIGRSIVKRLAKMGYNVVVNFISDSSKVLADDLIREITKEYGVEGLAIQADVAEYDDCKKIIDAAIEKFGRKIDVLVNNAGIGHKLSFLEITPEQYTRLINVNLMSCLHCSHLVLPFMAEAKEGVIINISSIGGMMGVSRQADYCAAKSGVIGLTRGLAIEFGPYNIRVNNIAPGLIWTDMLKGADQDALKIRKEAVPLGEIGEVEDISQCVEYLVKAKYMTGQTVSPNGGILMP